LSSPFDDALEHRELARAAEVYASTRGGPGSPEYRAAWLQFRRKVKTIEDLRSARARAAVRARTRRAAGLELEP